MPKNSTPRAIPGRRSRARVPVTSSKSPIRSDLGLALAGGGPMGVTYEIGALNALAESLDGFEFTDLGVYVGVSAGSVLAAGLANGITPREICRLFIEGEPGSEEVNVFDPAMLLQPAGREFIRRLNEFPPVVSRVLRRLWESPTSSGWGIVLNKVGRLLPTGLFDNSNIHHYLEQLFAVEGRTNDFRKLRSKLILVATDLDSGRAVELGSGDFDYVPISRAVQASAALPLLFPPVTIAGRNYVDGALTKTLHASGAYKAGARLVIGVNPLVPYDADAGELGARTHRALLPGGLPMVLSQTFRALIHSRMKASVARYQSDYPDLDLVLFEPGPAEVELFFTNIFSYSSRRRLCEYAYQSTRADLLKRSGTLAPIFARHGITLRLDVLKDPNRRLVSGKSVRAAPPVVRELDSAIGALEAWLRPGDKRPAFSDCLQDVN